MRAVVCLLVVAGVLLTGPGVAASSAPPDPEPAPVPRQVLDVETLPGGCAATLCRPSRSELVHLVRMITTPAQHAELEGLAFQFRLLETVLSGPAGIGDTLTRLANP